MAAGGAKRERATDGGRASGERRGLSIPRVFTRDGESPFDTVGWTRRTSRITNPDGSVVFEMADAEVPAAWSQVAADIMVSKYFRKAGVPQVGADGAPLRDETGQPVLGPERSARQVIHRLAGCWRHWGETHGYFATASDAQAFYDELAHTMLRQMAAPNSPQWFNTGLAWAYGITGPAQGHYYVDPADNQVKASTDAYTRPQPHACQPYHALVSTPRGPVAIGDIVTQDLVGLPVYDGREGGRGLTRVVAVKANGVKPVYRIVLKNGLTVEATPDHLVSAVDERRAESEWRRVEELRPGQRLRVSTVTEVTATSGVDETTDAALVGWLQGDGFVGQYAEGTNTGLTVEFMTVNDDEFAYVMDRVERVFPDVRVTVRAVESDDPRLDIRRIRLDGEPLRPFVDRYDLLNRGEEMAVPVAIRTSGRAAQAAYLQALFQADGTVRLRKRRDRAADVVLSTTSPRLAADVQSLLLNHGIYARVERGSDKRENRRTPYHVTIGYAEARERFAATIGFVSEDKRRKLAAACSDEFPGKKLPGLREEAIVRIEFAGTHEVFDIQTESGQYLSNNVVVHNCFIQSVDDTLVGPGGLMDLWVREARIFKYGSGTGTNFSAIRGEGEPLSGGGTSSGLMSFLKVGDRAAGAIKSGGTTRRAAKMVIVDIDHPDVEKFIAWKVDEEKKVAGLIAAGYASDFNGDAYATVSGQNSNNSVRVTNEFLEAVARDEDWHLRWRTSPAHVSKTVRARALWRRIADAAWACADPGIQFDTTINEWHTCPASGRINGSNPCFAGGTRILTEQGLMRIDRLVGEGIEGRFTPVLRRDGSRSRPSQLMLTGMNPILRVTLSDGRVLRTTPNHTWILEDGTRKAASDLAIGDQVGVGIEAVNYQGNWDLPFHVQRRLGERALPRIPERWTPELAEILGHLIGDGCIDASGVTVLVYGTHDHEREEAAERHKAWLETIFGVAVSDTRVGNGCRQLRISRRAVGRFFAELGVTSARAHDKRVPDAIFTAPKEIVAAFLRGYFGADGTCYGRQEMGECEVSAGSASHDLLGDLQLLLQLFGIRASSAEQRGAGGRSFGDYESRAQYRLRLHPADLATFADEIGFSIRYKQERLKALLAHRRMTKAGPWQVTVAHVEEDGEELTYNLTEPHDHAVWANGVYIAQCSEYMFLDDTACNLASLNLLTFLDDRGNFDVAAFQHAVRLWTIVLEISVLMAQFPSEAIARQSFDFRTLGLGYANLGTVLMRLGMPYDSDEARAYAGAVTALMTGESYAASAELAAHLGPFPEYAKNAEPMLRVIRNHRRAAYDASAAEYEGLSVLPMGIDPERAPAALLAAARESWDRALALGEAHGYRNAQTTLLAPTGTIGLLMDCDTTGVEPDFALVKFKKLAGGGYFKIANQSVDPALRNLGYDDEQRRAILTYLLGTMSLDGAPFVNRDTLRTKGLTDDDLDKIERALPGVFELGFAFNAWTLGEEALGRLGLSLEQATAPGFDLLAALGFSRREIDAANEVICGRMTVEGAPHLKPEHLPVFDCANKNGKTGTRFIHHHGHIQMMSAAQSFLSGAISKTINMPNEATVADVEDAYAESWKGGIKAMALYRDGSKLSQPLSTKSDVGKDRDQEADGREAEIARAVDEAVAAAVTAARAEWEAERPAAAAPVVAATQAAVAPARPSRRRLPAKRSGFTQEARVAGNKVFLRTGEYEDGTLGEIFIDMHKEGAAFRSMINCFAIAISKGLQYGVPLEEFVDTFTFTRFEPQGMVSGHPNIKMATSIIDYVFRVLGLEYLGRTDLTQVPPDLDEADEAELALGAAAVTPPAADQADGSAPTAAATIAPAAPVSKGPNGAGGADHAAAPAGQSVTALLEQTTTLTVLDAQLSELMGDAPFCDVCGHITVRNGACYKCLNCGNSLGCS